MFPFHKTERVICKMKKRFSGFLAGCVTSAAILVLGTTVLAAGGQVSFNFANVALDGETKITAGADITAPNGQQVPSSILYTDETGGKTNYLPVRTISELLGVEIGYDSATKTVLLGEQDAASQGTYWQRTVDGASFTYASQRPADPYTAPPVWRPAWLPEGWALSGVSGGTARASCRYRSEAGTVTASCAYPDGGSFGASLRQEESVQNVRQVTVQGCSADLYTEENKAYLVWEGEDGILFWLSASGISAEDLVKMAQSMQPDTTELPAYRLSWVPAGYSWYEHAALGDAAQETWLGPDTSLTLLYASEPVEVPEGTPDDAEVNGIEARYWGAEEPYESDGSMTVNGETVEGNRAEVNGVTITTGTIVGLNSDGVNVLAWEDPDTGIFFRLHGTVGKSTLLRIAEDIQD